MSGPVDRTDDERSQTAAGNSAAEGSHCATKEQEKGSAGHANRAAGYSIHETQGYRNYSVSGSSRAHQEAPLDTPGDSCAGSHKRCLFVGDIARFCVESELYDFFCSKLSEAGCIGQVDRVSIKKSETGINLGFGFVWFKTHDAALLAMQVVNGQLFCARPLRIRWGVRREEIIYVQMKSQTNQPLSVDCPVSPAAHDSLPVDNKSPKGVTANSLYVRFNTKKVGLVVTESTLSTIFGKFGEVVDSSIRSSFYDKVNGKQYGFAFVHFKDDVSGIQLSLFILQNFCAFQNSTIVISCEPSKNLFSLLADFPDPMLLVDIVRRTLGKAPASTVVVKLAAKVPLLKDVIEASRDHSAEPDTSDVTYSIAGLSLCSYKSVKMHHDASKFRKVKSGVEQLPSSTKLVSNAPADGTKTTALANRSAVRTPSPELSVGSAGSMSSIASPTLKTSAADANADRADCESIATDQGRTSIVTSNVLQACPMVIVPVVLSTSAAMGRSQHNMHTSSYQPDLMNPAEASQDTMNGAYVTYYSYPQPSYQLPAGSVAAYYYAPYLRQDNQSYSSEFQSQQFYYHTNTQTGNTYPPYGGSH